MNYANPVVLLSGGVDSILALYLTRQDYPQADCITFSEDFTKAQRAAIERLIFDFDLTVYTFPPANRYLVPNGEDVSLVDEYLIAGVPLPVIRDFEHSDKCVFDLSGRRTSFWLGWDAVITGRLKSDSHPAIGTLVKEKVIDAGNFKIVSPLFDWTKEEVIAKAGELDLLKYVVEPDTGNVHACTKCLKGDAFCPKENRTVEKLEFDREAMGNAFREKYGV